MKRVEIYETATLCQKCFIKNVIDNIKMFLAFFM